MPRTQKDTEITLGTGRMLAIFFALVLVCAFFFSIGFSLGRRTSAAVGSTLQSVPGTTVAPVVRPSAVKNNGSPPATGGQAGDYSFYKSVGSKTADSTLAPKDSKLQSDPANSRGDASAKSSPPVIALPATSAGGTYYVQVAAVSRQEDADSLVEALKKKQYPAAAINNASGDKFFRVQVGPYGELKDAEAMRQRLIGDGYNPIVKK
jgi:cell division septation protein DedD